MRTFTARYPGRCAACPDRIDEGDEITLGERGEPMHAECAADRPLFTSATRREPGVCPRCFITHAGDCF